MSFQQRIHHINRLRSRIERDGFPRLQMLLIVAITGAAGFLASYSLLRAGLTAMGLRYACALGIAYLVFLFLLWLWLRTSASDYTDIPDVSGFFSGPNGKQACTPSCNEAGAPSTTCDAADTGMPLGDGGAVSDALGAAAEADEFAIPLVVLVLLAALLFSSFFVIYSAPVLFAELMLDGVLAATLYRRLRGLETRHWLETAVRRTATPFIVTTLFVAGSGWGMQTYAPEAHSIGDVIAHAKRIR